MVLIFPALTIALASLTLAESDALGYWEKRVSLVVTIVGGILGGTFVAILIVLFLIHQALHNYQVPALALFLVLLGVVVLMNLRRPKAVPHGNVPQVSIAKKEGETWFRFAYVSMLFSLVVALAVVPSIVFFQGAREMEVTNLSRMGQVRWIISLAERAQWLRRETPIISSTIYEKDIYTANGFPAPIECPPPGKNAAPSGPEGRILLIPELLNGLGLPSFTPLMSFAAELRSMTSVPVTTDTETGPYTWRSADGADGAEVMVVNDERLNDLLDTSIGCNRGLGHNHFDSGEPWSEFVRSGFPCFETTIPGDMALSAILAAFVGFAALWSIVCKKLFLLDADLDGDESSTTMPVDLTKEEKLALWHVTRLGFLSPGDSAQAGALFRRGALYRNPAFRVRDAEYRQIQRISNSEMLQLEQEAQPPISPHLRNILPVGIALALVFFFLTQRELFNSASAIIAAVATALPTVLRFFSQLGGSPEKS
jgi:hypothetical protein